MMNLSLREIAEACGGKLVLKDCLGADAAMRNGLGTVAECDTCVMSVVLDSRRVERGGVFVATIGERVDGHKFVASVFEQGAVLAIVQKTPEQVETEHGIPVDAWGSYVLVADTLQALKDIAEYYRSKLAAKIVGITGSVGKTSTKEFIAGVLAEKFNVLKTEGNFNNEIGVPLTLLRIREEHEVAVVEMGISDFGEMHRLSKMARPDICVITNIGQCHLENLKTRDGILQAKSEIFDFMAENGEVCLNGDDDKLCTLGEVKGRTPHFFGVGQNATVGAEEGFEKEVYAADIVSHGLWGSDAMLVCKDRNNGSESRFSIEVPLPGVHMVLNAAASACVARLFGLTEREIAAGISKIAPVSGRNNLLRLSRNTIIDDCYNANPVSMKAAIDLLAMADTPKVAILGDMFELGENASALHAGVGIYAGEAGIDRVICVGEESKHMFDALVEVQSKESDGGMQQRSVYYATRIELLDALKGNADELIPEGSTVLVKASHGMAFGEVVEELKKLSE